MSDKGLVAGLSAALRSWRIGSVALQSFSSGLPYGLVTKAMPAWLAVLGVDIATIGLFSLSRLPWNLKFLWSPLMDRYSLPFLGRKRSWMAVSQLLLVASLAMVAWYAATPAFSAAEAAALANLPALPGQRQPAVPAGAVFAVGVLALVVAFASASQDIAIDGYAVEVLEEHEQGVAVGLRTALWRMAYWLSGGLLITASMWWGWPAVFAGSALLFVPLIGVVAASPEPVVTQPPPRSLREAVFEPLVAVFRAPRALEILAFVLLYKLSDQLAVALTSPFLIEAGFSLEDVGLATATIGLLFVLVGTFLGGALTEWMGLGNALWAFGVLQAVSNLGYAAVDQAGVDRPVMYAAIALDSFGQGVGAGAFGVFLLRLTSRQFSATQYALFSSIFALGGTLTGPVAGVLAELMGWTPFFVFTVFAAIPGLVLLQRFAPLGTREPELLSIEAGGAPANPVSRMVLGGVGGAVVVLATGLGAGTSVLLAALRAAKTDTATFAPELFDLAGTASAWFHPDAAGDWARIAGVVAFGVVTGGLAAALVAARRGVR